MEITVEITAGPKAGHSVEFARPGNVTFGRAPDCTFVVEDPAGKLSRHHFIIQIQPGEVLLVDLGSRNGTRVNGVKVGGRARGTQPEDARASEAVPLSDGDRIRAGGVELVIRISGMVRCADCGVELATEQASTSRLGERGAHVCRRCQRRARAARDRRRRREAHERERIPGGGALFDPEDLKLDLDQRMRAEEDPGGVIQEILGAPADANEETAETPRIGDYKLIRVIGKGGFGIVYLAERVTDGARVALKTMLQTRRPDATHLLVFDREKQISQQLDHPNVVRCHRIGQWQDVHFMELEYLERGSLFDLMRKHGRIPLPFGARLMVQVLEGLAYAHEAEIVVETRRGPETVRGVVHRDLKPPNILMSGDKKQPTAKLADFGLAKAFEAVGMTKGQLSTNATFCGTPPYLAPEHLISYRDVRPPTDVFEAAATFYHMLTGRTVWRVGPDEDLFRLILEQRPDPIRKHLPGLPRQVAGVIDKALCRDVEDRFPDGRAFLGALEAALERAEL